MHKPAFCAYICISYEVFYIIFYIKMKRYIYSFVALFCIAGSAAAQVQAEDTLPYKMYEVGPLVTGGACVFNGTVPTGSKTDIRVAYTAGILGTYAANRDIGFALGLGYESRGMFFKIQNFTDPNETITLNYLSIQPSVRFKSFLLGINVGIPASSSFASVSNNANYPTGGILPSSPTFFTKDHMETVIDIRAEGLLPIVENDFGNLYFIIQASYPLSNAIKDPFLTVGQTTNNASPPTYDYVTSSPIPTVQIGLSYLFSPGAKTK